MKKSKIIDDNLILPEGTEFINTLLRLYKHNLISRIYREAHEKDTLSLINILLKVLNISIEIPGKYLNNIPDKGPFIAASNHPFRGIDSMILFKLIFSKRPDIKILGSHMLHEIEPLRDIIIPVRTFEQAPSEGSSYAGIRQALSHLSSGCCLGIFPAAEDSKYYTIPGLIIDSQWNPSAIKLIKRAGVPVVPVYFHGSLPRLRYLARIINPLINKPLLPAELVKKKKRNISVRIGSAITIKEQDEITDPDVYGRYLRARVYSLSASVTHGKKTKIFKVKPAKAPETVINHIDDNLLINEFNSVKADYELFSTKNYSVLCAPAYIIPNIFREIGRMREITFREVGEGTGKRIDIDRYDFYYQHLFIWDTDENRLVGAYRLGKGKEIMSLYGIKGFYISSLFRVKKSFAPVLTESVELGRSFLVSDYQKKPIPLFLLWKGIMVFLLKHTEYRYLIGPVSISNDLTKYSKSLLVDFIQRWYFDEELAKNIKPRKEFVSRHDHAADRMVIVERSEKDLDKIEKIIIDAEAGYRMPILLKKYLEINGRIIGFNIDPKFNNCLDGLLILDVYKTPAEFIAGLSREMNDPSILDRFNAGRR